MESKRLALRLMEWGGDCAPYTYSVGSYLFAGHTPSNDAISRAIGELLSTLQGAKHPECVTEQDIRECGRLAKQLVSLSTTLSVVLLSAGQSASS